MNNSPEKCLLCGVGGKPIKLDDYFDGNTSYSLYACSGCKGQFWVPFKNPGGKWYEQDERYSGINSDPYVSVNRHQKDVLKKVSSVLGNKKPKRLLDVGCGSGNFLAFARKYCWEVSGIDFDSNAISSAKEVFQIDDVQQKDIISYAESGGHKKFDLVTFFDVFEHIDNHKDFLSAVHGLLNNNGYIGMSMPHRDGSMWLKPYDYPPRHLTRWDNESLGNILLENGFNPIYFKIQRASLYFVILKLRFKYGKYLSFNLVKKIQSKSQDKKQKTGLSKSFNPKIEIIKFVAKVKDFVVFGLPAIFVWFYFFIRGELPIGLVVIAQKIND